MYVIDSLVESLFVQKGMVSTDFSVLCITTTNPVYLVFHEHSCYPLFVIRSANSKADKRVHYANFRLSVVAKGVVPEVLGLFRHEGKLYSVQKGVQGSPWFKMARLMRVQRDRSIIREQALQALDAFRKGVQTVPEWKMRIRLGDCLRSAYRAFLEIETDMEVGTRNLLLKNLVYTMASTLDREGLWEGIWQHGDFSLNNLLFDGDHATVIDFEDFGITLMPLYDEFTLALSLNGLSTTLPSIPQFSEELYACTNSYVQRFSLGYDTVQALFLSHLLIRLGSWSAEEKRLPYRRKLLTLLDQYIEAPNRFIPLSG